MCVCCLLSGSAPRDEPGSSSWVYPRTFPGRLWHLRVEVSFSFEPFVDGVVTGCAERRSNSAAAMLHARVATVADLQLACGTLSYSFEFARLSPRSRLIRSIIEYVLLAGSMHFP